MNSFIESKIVITGGAGFIGSHLTEKLLALGANVTVVDDLNYGNKISHLAEHRNLHICKADVRTAEKVHKAIENASILLHFASVVGVEEAYENPIEVLDVEIKGTVNVLNAALRHDVKRVVFASSSEIYGDGSTAVSYDGSFNPKSTYSYSKLIGEEYCRAFYQEHGVEYVCLRYFNVYGPRQDERFVIPRFVKKVLNNEPPLIYGDGNQVRDFTFVQDAVDMTLLAATHPQAKCEAFNVGTGTAVTINELASLLIKIMGKEGSLKPVYINYDEKRPRKIEVFNRVADTSNAQQILGYKCQTSLETGLRKYIDWYLKTEKR